MQIEEILNKACIHFDEDLKSKDEVFYFLCSSLFQAGIIDNQEMFLKKVYYRETLSVTGLIEGVAIPHGVSDTVKKPSVAFVRVKGALKWESIDGKKCKYIFLLAIPENSKDDTHIKMISELARSLMNEETIMKLDCVETADELLSLLKKGGQA